MWNIKVYKEKEVLIDVLINPKNYEGISLESEEWESEVLSEIYNVYDLWEVNDKIYYEVEEVYGINWPWQE